MDADITLGVENGYLTVTVAGSAITDNMEVLRFQQNDITDDGVSTDFIETVGSSEIAIRDLHW